MVGDGVNERHNGGSRMWAWQWAHAVRMQRLEQAEVVLMHDQLENFQGGFQELSQRARRINRQNLIISLGTVAVLVMFCLAR